MATTNGATLQDALISGQGIERPFRCEVHDDTMASASVNVVKMIWYCHACHASGSVDGKKAPSVEMLEAMIKPDRACRQYPDAFLELYSDPGYWLTRFPAWLCHALGLGYDPFTDDAIFPVHTPGGLLAGIGRRKATLEEGGPRYKYPHNWSAAATLFGSGGRYPRFDVLCLGEGAADAAAVWEVGCPGLAVYGAGLHFPQRELLARYAPKLIILGFDMDKAGENAVTRGFKAIGQLAPVVRVKWPAKDPGECTVEERHKALLSAVRRSGYRADVLPTWEANVIRMQAQYQRYVEER